MKRYKKRFNADNTSNYYENKYRKLGLLFEKSLSRIYKHFKDSGFIISSAFRPIVEDPEERKLICGVASNKENMTRHQQLLKWLKSKRLGFIVIDGVWVDQKTKIKYPELSVFVPYRDIYTYDEFLQLAMHWTSKGDPKQGHFCQDGVLVKDADELYNKLFLLSKDSSTKTMKGIFQANKIAEIYSQFKQKNEKHTSKHSGRTFTFEGVQTYDKFYSRSILIEEGHIFV